MLKYIFKGIEWLYIETYGSLLELPVMGSNYIWSYYDLKKKKNPVFQREQNYASYKKNKPKQKTSKKPAYGKREITNVKSINQLPNVRTTNFSRTILSKSKDSLFLQCVNVPKCQDSSWGSQQIHAALLHFLQWWWGLFWSIIFLR